LAAAAAAQRRRKEKRDEEQAASPCSGASGEALASHSAEADEAHSIKSRVGNFKVSKLSRLVEDIATAVGSDVRFDVRTNTAEAAQADDEAEGREVDSAEGATAEERQIALEQRAVGGTLEIIRCVRATAVHRRLPHYHAVDRQLDAIARLLDIIADNLADFWRYGREEPMADLLSLPLMQLAVNGGNAAIVPMPQCFLDGTGDVVGNTEETAATLLGVAPEAGQEAVESAYRNRARELHQHGECVNLEAFHQLTDAYDLLMGRRRASSSGAAAPASLGAGGLGAEVLAHYLLVGTDASGSRYREYARGILDAAHRERLMQKAEVLVNWGEASGSMTGLGQG